MVSSIRRAWSPPSKDLAPELLGCVLVMLEVRAGVLSYGPHLEGGRIFPGSQSLSFVLDGDRTSRTLWYLWEGEGCLPRSSSL